MSNICVHFDDILNLMMGEDGIINFLEFMAHNSFKNKIVDEIDEDTRFNVNTAIDTIYNSKEYAVSIIIDKDEDYKDCFSIRIKNLDEGKEKDYAAVIFVPCDCFKIDFPYENHIFYFNNENYTYFECNMNDLLYGEN